MGLERMVSCIPPCYLQGSYILRLPDLELSKAHPKRAFDRRVLDIEIRLAYYDRILQSVPEPYHSPEAGILPEQAPGPDFAYADPSMYTVEPPHLQNY